MGGLRKTSVNEPSDAKVVQIRTDIKEFSVLDAKTRQDDGLVQPVPNSWFKPLIFSGRGDFVFHDVVNVRREEGRLGWCL